MTIGFFLAINIFMINVINKNIYINSNSFKNNTTLNSVDLCYVPYINNDMSFSFINCYNLKSVSNVGWNTTNMHQSFAFCNNLIKSPQITNKVTDIAGIYYNCTNLKYSSIIPNSVTNMHSAYAYCRNLVNLPEIPNSVIDMRAAYDGVCNAVNFPNLPDSVLNIYATYVDCTNMIHAPRMSNNITDAIGAFQNCFNLVDVDISNTKATNLYVTFGNCTNLTNAGSLPSTVTDMNMAYHHCYNLINAPAIPNSVVNMIGTFIDCTNLYNTPTIPDSVVNMAGTYQRCHNIQNPPHIGNNVETIWGLFENSGPFTHGVNVPDSVINAGWVYNGCYGLTTITSWGNNVEQLASACTLCSNLTTLPESFPTKITNMLSTFQECYNLTSCPKIPDSVVDSRALFYNCVNLTSFGGYSNNATEIVQMFQNCAKIQTLPDMPDCVINGYQAFFNCYNLQYCNKFSNALVDVSAMFQGDYNLKSVDAFPDSVTNMYQTFALCSSLYQINGFSNNLRDTYLTFYGCSNLATVPNIPSSAVNLIGTFYGCSKLTGNIYIHSSNVINAIQCFYSTSLQKNVYIPFEYENGVDTLTYNTFVAAGYDTSGNLNGVKLKNIDGNIIKIQPTPNDAVVRMIDTSIGANVDLSQFTYTLSSGAAEITALNTNETDIVVPQIYTETSKIKALDGVIVDYIVSKDGYETVSGNIEVEGTQIVSVPLTRIMCTVNIISMIEEATIVLSASGYSQVGNSITVPWGTEVTYSVSKEHYVAKTGTIVVKTDTPLEITLDKVQHEFRINPSPIDATVQILVDGELVNGTNTDWVFTSNGFGGDIELQEYNGTAVDVTLPTTYDIATNVIIADYGSVIDYKVTFGSNTTTGTLTLTEDTSIDVGVSAEYNVTDYTYTLDSDVLTLESYIGNGGDISVPSGE